MLTSSDAKFRCLWYMVVWAVLLMIVSQFFRLIDHIAFYIFASAAMLLLPFVTSVYSTTSGQHGAGILRVSYIFCDPVLACVTVIPVLLLRRLPLHLDESLCLQHSSSVSDNATLLSICTNNSLHISQELQKHIESNYNGLTSLRQQLLFRICVIQASLLAPPLLTLTMGRRSRKMSYPTVVVVACYWLVASIETADLISLEVIAMATPRRHTATSTATIVAIAMILINSYGVVTLCSYICPSDCNEESSMNTISHFDTLYRCLVGGAGVLFAEIPLLTAHIQVISVTTLMPATFYIWTAKDCVFILVAMVTVVYYTVCTRHTVIGASCGRLAFDNPDVFFLPEKRDAYIIQHQQIGKHVTVAMETDKELSDTQQDSLKKKKRVTFRFDLHHGRHGNIERGRHSDVNNDSCEVQQTGSKVADSTI